MITRRLIQLLITLFLVALLAMVGLVLFVDPNRYKDVIVKKVEGTLDRPFAITGDIGWRFWPRLGLTLNGVELGQAKGFTTDNNNQFAKIGEASVYVAITPLLSKHIEVDKLLIKDAHFYFARHSDGTNNWDDLRHLQKSPKTTETKTTTRTDSFDWMISDLAIQDTEIIWNDAKNKQKIGAQIKELSTALEADHTNPIDAVFDVVIEPGHIQATVQVESDYSFDPGYQRYTAEHGQITMKVTGLDGLKGPQDIDAHFEALRLDLKQDQLQIEKLKANIFDGHLSANLSGDNISKTPHMQGVVSLENINLQKLGQALGKELHITEDKLKTLNAEATFKNTANGFTIDPFAAQLGDTRVNGTLSADKAISNLKFNLNVNHVHFQDAKNTAGKTTKTGAKSKSSKSVMPTRIQKITAVGDIHIDSATIGGMNLQNIDMHINAKNGTVNLAPLKAHLYSGELSTTTAIHLQNPIPYFDIDAKLSHINVGSFLKDRGSKSKFQGHLNLQTKLKTQGLDRDRIVNSLNGTAKFNIDDGVLHGIDLGYWLSVGETMLLSAKNLTTLAVTAAEAAIGKTDTKETVFKAMSGSFTLTQGIAQNKDLTLYNDRFYTSGIGQINLPKQTLDYALRVSNAKKTANGYQATEPKIPLKVTGPLQQPHISIDPAGIQALLVQSLTSGLKTTVQTALPILNAPAAIIDGVTGNHSSNTNNNTSSSTTTNTDSATPTQNKPPPEQVIKDTLKGILGQ